MLLVIFTYLWAVVQHLYKKMGYKVYYLIIFSPGEFRQAFMIISLIQFRVLTSKFHK